MKSFAGVRAPKKIFSQISSRLIAIEMAWRRKLPSLPLEVRQRSGMVSDEKFEPGSLYACDRVVLLETSCRALGGTSSRTSRLPACTSL